MECNKCGCTKIQIAFDSRGLAEARCADCGSLIKKMKTQEVADYYEERLAELADTPEKDIDSAGRERKTIPCRYCIEDYVIVRGNMKTARQYVPITAKFCPICGRELQPTDRDY